MGYDQFNEVTKSGVCEFLSESQSLVLIYLSVRVDKARGEAWPSRKVIAFETGLKESTVRRAVSELRSLQLVRSRRTWSQIQRCLVTYYRVAPDEWLRDLIEAWDSVISEHRRRGQLNVRRLQRDLVALAAVAELEPQPGDQLELVDDSGED